MSERNQRFHPAVPELQKQLRPGRIGRREFLRTVTLLGVSAGTAYALAACAPAAHRQQHLQRPPLRNPLKPPKPLPLPQAIKRGGVLKVGIQVPAVDHPARFSWVFDSNEFRQVFEYLTETGSDNITRPYLLDSWTPNTELTEWTLKLKKGIKWSNGDELTSRRCALQLQRVAQARDQVFDSGFVGRLPQDRRRQGRRRPHHQADVGCAQAGRAGDLFHYPAQIMHRSFNGDVTTRQEPRHRPNEAGRVQGERARGGQGARRLLAETVPTASRCPISMASSISTWATTRPRMWRRCKAARSMRSTTQQSTRILALRDKKGMVIEPINTTQVRVLRLRVDEDPWKDNKVRQALKLCQDRAAILDKAYFGQGDLGGDFHVSPVHPEYAPIDSPKYDPEKSLALLKEAGVTTPLKVKIAVGTGWTDIVAYVEALKESAKAGGFDIELDTMPNRPVPGTSGPRPLPA